MAVIREFPGGDLDRRRRQLLQRAADPEGRARDRHHDHRLAEGAGAAARACRSSPSRSARSSAPPTVADRGYYFDLIEFQKNHENGMTPSTPIIPLIYALKSKLEDIKAEGLAARYARHARLNKTVRDWGAGAGLQALPQGGLRLGHAQLLRQHPELRPRRPQQDPQGQAPPRDRRRLRQAQGQDLPDLQHGRRDRRHDRRARRRPSDSALAETPKAGSLSADRKTNLEIRVRGAYRLAAP